ncbi:MAG: hypothetical protein ACLQJR_25085 [Stellaceae bacterium]
MLLDAITVMLRGKVGGRKRRLDAMAATFRDDNAICALRADAVLEFP